GPGVQTCALPISGRESIGAGDHPAGFPRGGIGRERGGLHLCERHDQVHHRNQQDQRSAEELHHGAALITSLQSFGQATPQPYQHPHASSTRARPATVITPLGPSIPSTGIGALTCTSTTSTPR